MDVLLNAPCKKIKKDYCEGLCDSLDLVPIGAWYGNGRKVCMKCGIRLSEQEKVIKWG